MGAKRGRSLGLDVARGLGIALVFYGHFMEKLAGAGSDPAQLQWKWVYAFHMPLFFFLAGIFWRPRRAGPARWLGGKLRARLLPVASFSALLLPLWFWMLGPSPEWRMLLEAYLYGQPTLDWATWFLVCLLMVECWIALLSALLPLDRRGGLAVR
ncbi:MAG: acyltransferase family protein [Myxococcota bacterium]